MRNKIYYLFIGLCIGAIFAAWVRNQQAEATPTFTETSEVKQWQQNLIHERALQLDNQGPDITIPGFSDDILITDDNADITFYATEPNLIWAIGTDIDWTELAITGDIDWGIDIVEYYDFVFSFDDVEVKFKMTDGKFDVIYDPNECTAAANTFFVCMKPHLQGMILEKTKELVPPNHITISCECGGNLVCAVSYQPEHWPFEITCIKCETKYVVTREVAKEESTRNPTIRAEVAK